MSKKKTSGRPHLNSLMSDIISASPASIQPEKVGDITGRKLKRMNVNQHGQGVALSMYFAKGPQEMKNMGSLIAERDQEKGSFLKQQQASQKQKSRIFDNLKGN